MAILIPEWSKPKLSDKERFVAALTDESWEHLRKAFNWLGWAETDMKRIGGIHARSAIENLRECSRKLKGFEFEEYT